MTRYWLLACIAMLALGTAAYAQTKPAPPIRGDANIEMTEPVVKNSGNTLITTFKVKNVGSGSSIGFRVDVFRYDKKGEPVTGSSFRNPRPLQPVQTR